MCLRTAVRQTVGLAPEYEVRATMGEVVKSLRIAAALYPDFAEKIIEDVRVLLEVKG